MLHLLFGIILLQAALILAMVFRTPARKLVILSLDRTKRGSGRIIAMSVAGTVLAVLGSSLHSTVKAYRVAMHQGEIDPTTQVLMANHLLEASLMGFFLFLALITDRLHYYIRELHMRRRGSERKRGDNFRVVEEIVARETQVDTFKDIVRGLGHELDTKTEELASADTKIDAFKKKSEELLLAYDSLLAENQEFRARLVSLDQQVTPGN